MSCVRCRGFNQNNSVTLDGDLNVGLADGANLDAFGRLRTSEPYTLFDSKQIYDSEPLFWDDAQTSGAGTATSHSVALASTQISVSNLTAGTRVRQTKRRFNYQSGKSQFILLTGVLATSGTGITKRVGYFDQNNGLFFQLQNSVLSVVRRTSTSGAPIDVVVPQTDWNIDPLDGMGVSGITLDTTKTQIFAIDFEWLGVGRVRYGFVINGILYYCHELYNANTLDVVYMSTPNLPCRYEISNDGTGGASSLYHICTSVMSEGGQEDTGKVLSVSNGNTEISANVSGVTYPAIGMRLKPTHLSATIMNLSSSILGTTTSNDYIHWKLILNPVVTGTFTYNDLSNSALQIAYGSTATCTGGTLLNSGYIAQKSGIETILKNSLLLGSTIAGVSDAIVLTVMPISGGANLDIFTSLTWRELL